MNRLEYKEAAKEFMITVIGVQEYGVDMFIRHNTFPDILVRMAGWFFEYDIPENELTRETRRRLRQLRVDGMTDD